jgi:hypothetical protein
MALKPGYRSTEFYGSAVATILGGVAASGFLSPDLVDTVGSVVEQIPEVVQVIDSLFDGAIRLAGVIFGIGSQIRYGGDRAIAKKMPEKVIIRK